MDAWLESLIGVKYKESGRTVDDGLDCYGVVRLVMAEKLGMDLPDNPAMWRRRCEMLPRDAKLEMWDVLCFEGEGAPLGMVGHIGVYIGRGDFIHAGKPYGGVVCEPVEKWRHRIISVARPVSSDT